MSQTILNRTKPLIAFDLEATGLEPSTDRIVEFCFVELNGELQPGQVFKSLVEPGIPVPPEVTAIHGLSDDDLRGQPKFASFAGKIQRLVDGSVMIAHNSRFDLALLHYELVRAGQKGVSPNHPVIDTLAIEHLVNGHNLGAAYARYCGEDLSGAHRAEADTLATIAVLREQRARYPDALGPSVDDILLSRVRQNNGSDGRIFLDHGRRFVKEPNGVIRLNFGKHRGEDVSEHHSYLRWMLKADFADDTKEAAKQILKS